MRQIKGRRFRDLYKKYQNNFGRISPEERQELYDIITEYEQRRYVTNNFTENVKAEQRKQVIKQT